MTLILAIALTAHTAAMNPPDDGLANTTPNSFLISGKPTFIVGTSGDDQADRGIRAQVDLIREMLFPEASIVDDTTIDAAAGPKAWPPNPVVYGGPHVNSLLKQLTLPFRMEAGRLTLGGRTFEGDDYRLIAVVPARPANGNNPGHPEFLLYAGTGTPGVAEINAVRNGPEPILIADGFGRLLTGRWRTDKDGSIVAEFPDSPARRIIWREVECPLGPNFPGQGPLKVLFPKQLPPAKDEKQIVEAVRGGLTDAAHKLEIAKIPPIRVYIYPDRRSKQSLTGDAGDGHAVVAARMLHVVQFDPAEGGGLERLLVHEGTHILTNEAWGPAGTPLMGEGVAVWASGQYGGRTLEQWKRELAAETPPLKDLLGVGFRRMPERRSYPPAALVFNAAVKAVGLKTVRDHLYGATPSTWPEACRRAGTTREALEQAFRESLQP